MRRFASVLAFALIWAQLAPAQSMPPPVDPDVVFLGEVHDNPHHHAFQAQNIAERGPAALVFEMLSPADATAAADVPRNDRDAMENALGWADSGWPDFTIYHPLFQAAPDAAIYGAELGTDLIPAVFATENPEDLAALLNDHGLAPLSSADQAVREARQADAHCGALPAGRLAAFVAVQRLRDLALATAASEAVDETGGPVIVIAGTGHVRTDIGAPAELARLRPDLRSHAVGLIEDDATTGMPFDAIRSAPAVARPDPCAAFD